MSEIPAMMCMTSADIARTRLLGIVHKDRETAPTYRWRKVREATRLWFDSGMHALSPAFMMRAGRQRKAKYRLERRT